MKKAYRHSKKRISKTMRSILVLSLAIAMIGTQLSSSVFALGTEQASSASTVAVAAQVVPIGTEEPMLEEMVVPANEPALESELVAESDPEATVEPEPETASSVSTSGLTLASGGTGDDPTVAPGGTELVNNSYPVKVMSAAPLPVRAYLAVTEVPADTARALLGTPETQVAFAYDIKIMVPGENGDTEYQPPEGSPVTVTIDSAAPDGQPIEVTHIAENKATGTRTPETVHAVTTSAGAVEFETDGFSVFVGTVKTNGGNGNTITFNAETGYSVQYCETQDGSYMALANASSVIINGTNFYFKVTGADPYVFLSNSTAGSPIEQITPTSDIYSITSINEDKTVEIASQIEFDLAMDNVNIGQDNGSGTPVYSGINSAGAMVTGTHADTNKYYVMQSNNSTPTSNGINLAGNGVTVDLTLAGLKSTRGSETTGSINIPAGPRNTKDVTIRLSGTNYLNSIQYFTYLGESGGGEVEYNQSSKLTITSVDGVGSTNGKLVISATGRTAAAGIGGYDGADVVTGLTIAGGTIEVITPSDLRCTGIGAGSNGYAKISITGGSVYVENYAGSAAIGGGQGASKAGGAADITISGGINGISTANVAGDSDRTSGDTDSGRATIATSAETVVS